MARYRFVTVWVVGAPVDAVWAVLQAAGEWPAWWPSVRRSEQLRAGQPEGTGSVFRFTFATRLGYRLRFTSWIVAVEPPHLIDGRVWGDLAGAGRWELSPGPAGTRVTCTWDVRTNRPWMNLLTPVATRLFSRNHDALMREGGQGLAARLGAPLLSG